MPWHTDPMPTQHIDTDPYYMTEAEERALTERAAEQEAELRDAIATALHDCRGDLYLARVRRIVVEELNKARPFAWEPNWQTKTPVPVPEMG